MTRKERERMKSIAIRRLIIAATECWKAMDGELAQVGQDEIDEQPTWRNWDKRIIPKTQRAIAYAKALQRKRVEK